MHGNGDSAEEKGTPRIVVASRTGAVALGYALLGALGLALAIPPNYASPVFPAAGFAVGLTLRFGTSALPGIWLGSFALNTLTAWHNHNLDWGTTRVAALLAIGATLQALAARQLVTRWLDGQWRSLDSERAVVRFLALSGPLACLIAATIGVGTLYFSGIIGATNILFSWWNWWLGDTLGVLTFAPLTLTFLARRDATRQGRRTVIAAPMLLTLTLVAAAFLGTTHVERTEQHDRIDDYAKRVAQALDRRLLSHHEALSSLRRLIEVTPNTTFGQFEHFTKLALEDNPDIFALSFNPYLRLDERANFEAQMAIGTGLPTFRIKERDPEKRFVVAGTRPTYVPVELIAPLEGNRTAIGYDILSEPIRRAAIERAKASGKPSATGPIRLVQEARSRVGLLTLHPAYRQQPGQAEGAATGELLGFAVSVIKVDDMARIAAGDLLPPGLVFRLRDPQVSGPQGILFESDDGKSPYNAEYAWQTSLAVADRHWTLDVFPTAAYLEGHHTMLAWSVGVIGLMFATLLQITLLAMTGRTTLVQRQVREQTIELRRAKEEADSASLAKSQFLATMSHEIRTPMNGILGMAQLLLDGDLSADERDDFLRTLVNSGKTLQSLLDDILDLSKVEAGKFELNVTPFMPGEVLNEIAALFRAAAQQKKLELTTDWQGPAGAVYWADAIRIRQMLANLVSNAIKFSDSGSIRITAAETERTGDFASLTFSVADSGVGIPPDKLALLFRPFSQVDGSSARRFGGAGLGLSIVHRLAEMMGGTTGVVSEEGRGSRFWFSARIALAQNGFLPRVPSAPQRPIGAGAAWTATPTILLVEDNAINRKVAESLLRKRGIAVRNASNGQEALDALRADPTLQLVLMDCQMPLMDGFEATRRIRELERLEQLPRRPIIALTAGAFQDDRRRCVEAGMDDFLVKPIDVRELERLLNEWGIRADGPAA